jgi:hypothetical protein
LKPTSGGYLPCTFAPAESGKKCMKKLRS